MRHGFLLVSKPRGPTSHDIVGQVRRVLSERDIGHLGTLDPNASGLLVLAVGAKALKVVELYSGLPKEYVGEITLGVESTTYDADGVLEVVKPKPGVEPPEQAVIQRIIADHFIGKIDQTPPAHSAIHVGGERAYRKARQGKNVVMPSRAVEVTKFEILSYNYPVLKARIACSAGTYIRSFAHDLGQLLRSGGYLSALERTKVGEWSVENSVAPEEVSWAHVHPLKDILTSRGGVEINVAQLEAIRHGRDLPLEVRDNTIAWCEGLPVAILMPIKDGSQMAHPRKVL